MTKKTGILILAIAVLTMAVMLLVSSGQSGRRRDPHGSMTKQQRSNPTRVPAYMVAGQELQNLGPTLAPEQFTGKAREAYRIAREIPQTLAQLPCYCYCDEGFGHKSLHTCYESDHSAHCAVCVSEALMAYRLQKDEGLTPEQIRNRIVAQFGPK